MPEFSISQMAQTLATIEARTAEIESTLDYIRRRLDSHSQATSILPGSEYGGITATLALATILHRLDNL